MTTQPGYFAARQASIRPLTARFGGFQLIPTQRLLRKSGQMLSLNGRAFDVLLALVERAGEAVSKRDLLTLVWPQGVVEDSNIRVQVSILRRALADPPAVSRFIASLPGHGYTFVAEVRWENPSDLSWH